MIYADVNGDGIPDNNTPITVTPSLTPGQSFNFVVAEQVPAGQAATTTSNTTVTATSVLTPGIAATPNVDTVTVTNNAVINLNKSIDQTSGPTGVTRTYTLTYTNNSSTTATSLAISDTLPAGVTYVAGSGRYAGSGATPLSDAVEAGVTPEAASPELQYSFGTPANTVKATVFNVPAGVTGRITFQVTVNALSGVQQAPLAITNTATDSYNDGATTVNGSSNPATYTVTQTAGVLLTPPAAIPTANPGQTISFNNVVTNQGNGPDSFDVVVNTSGSTFPTGTTFALYKSDGVTPLVDNNGNTVPDTGIIARGATYTVILKATLPTNSPAVINGPYSVTKTATSRLDPTQTSTGTDTLTTITPQTVDIKNTATLGAGAGPEAAAVATYSGNPGTIVQIPLIVNNTGSAADTYQLQYSSTGNPTAFVPGVFPAGYIVTIHSGSYAGPVVTDTGLIAAGGSANFFVTVSIPAGQAASTQDIFFRALSPTSGTSDIVHDAITINPTNAITIEPNRTGQVFQGGSIVYSQVVTNNGNSPLTGVTLAVTNSSPNFTSSTYIDTNNNGVLDPSEIAAGPVTNLGTLAPGQKVNLLTQVFAPLGTTPGANDVTKLVVTGTTSASGTVTDDATDTTTVVIGALSILKEQSLDGTTFGNTNLLAPPGTRIYYRITVRNTGVTPVNNVVINDTTPSQTTYSAGAAGAVNPKADAVFTTNGGTSYTAGTNPGVGGVGAVTFNVGTLNDGAVAVAYFNVVING